MRRIFFVLLAILLAVPTAAVPVPVLMYHHFTNEETNLPDHCGAERFRAQLAVLAEAGYTTITFGDLLAYVDGTGDLPEKPVLLTSDDGYRSVIEIALPILREYGMTMSVAVIGNRMGASDGIPHFTMAEAADTGLELVSHTWALHGNGVLTAEGTLEAALVPDTEKMRMMAGVRPDVFVYPYGKYSEDSEAVLAALGYRITVTTRHGIADIRRGDTDSLRQLPRMDGGYGDLSVLGCSGGELLLAK